MAVEIPFFSKLSICNGKIYHLSGFGLRRCWSRLCSVDRMGPGILTRSVSRRLLTTLKIVRWTRVDWRDDLCSRLHMHILESILLAMSPRGCQPYTHNQPRWRHDCTNRYLDLDLDRRVWYHNSSSRILIYPFGCKRLQVN